MSSLVEMGVLEPLVAAPGVSLSAKRALARVNRLARATVLKYLYECQVLVVHEEDCTADNAAWVTKWLDVVPDAVLRVHGVEGEMELGLVRRAAKAMHDATWGGEENPLGPLYENATACYFLGFALATTWSRFYVGPGKKWCTVNNSMTVMGDDTADEVVRTSRTDRMSALFAGAHFHNALLRTEHFALDADCADRLRRELRKRLPDGVGGGANAAKRYDQLKKFVTAPAYGISGTTRGRVQLDGLNLNDSDMGVIAPRVRAERGRVVRLQLKNNAFGMIGAAALFAEPRPVVINPAWPRLTNLLLRGTPIGPDGYPQLCGAITAKHMPELELLDLAKTGMGDIGARLVFNAVRELKKLRGLDLDGNPFGAEGLKPLEWKAPSRNRVVVVGLGTLSMRDMSEAMDRAAWQSLGRAIMGGCFPSIKQLFASNEGTTAVGRVLACEPAQLAVNAVMARRKADEALKLAVAALSTSDAKKQANKRAKQA